MIRWKCLFKGFVTDLITDGCKQLKSAKEKPTRTGKANGKKKARQSGSEGSVARVVHCASEGHQNQQRGWTKKGDVVQPARI
jgi:hypothetical protein